MKTALTFLLLCLISASAAPISSTVRAISTIEGDSALHPTLLNQNAIWPVQNIPRSSISSTFGPRILVSGNRYDFHRGIDISAPTGTSIVAALSGTLYAKKTYTNGGISLILDHNVNVRFHGQTRTRMHTFYMHLDSYSPAIDAGSRGMAVSKGDVIGYVGDTGSAVTPHLHFELRVGSRCSLEYQLTKNKCVVGYDPHVHPLGLYAQPPNSASDLLLTEVSKLSATSDGVIDVSAPDSFPVANRYEVHLVKTDGSLELMAVMDLNLREGFDATSTSKLDRPIPVPGKPYIRPFSFGVSASRWNVEFVVPAGFESKAVGENYRVIVKNVFNDEFEIDIANDADNW